MQVFGGHTVYELMWLNNNPDKGMIQNNKLCFGEMRLRGWAQTLAFKLEGALGLGALANSGFTKKKMSEVEP